MKTIDIFRKAVKTIIKNTPSIIQKDIALRLNETVAKKANAISDLSDFLGGRRNYSLKKQEKLAKILGYNHIDLLIYGRVLIEKNGKIKNLEQEKIQKKIMLRSGKSYSILMIIKMVEDCLLFNMKEFQVTKSLLIDEIIRAWKEFKILSIARKRVKLIERKELNK